MCFEDGGENKVLKMQLPHVFIAFSMRYEAFPHVFIAFLAPPSFLLGAHWALLGSPFRHVGGARGASWASFGFKMEPETSR